MVCWVGMGVVWAFSLLVFGFASREGVQTCRTNKIQTHKKNASNGVIRKLQGTDGGFSVAAWRSVDNHACGG